MTLKVVDGTEPTLSMPMLVVNGHGLVYRGEDTVLCTAAREIVPLTSEGDDWYLKVLINNKNVHIRMDVWAACHECPPSWVRCLNPESVERRTAPESTIITKTRIGFEVKNSSSPDQTGAAGKPRSTMLEDVGALMPAIPWCDHAESAIPSLEETDIAAVHTVFDAQNFSLLLSGVETRKDPNKPWYESSGLSPREGSSTQPKSKTKYIMRRGWSNGHFGPHPRQSSLQRVHLANTSFADAWRNRDTVSFHVVPPKDLQEAKDLEVAQELLRFS